MPDRFLSCAKLSVYHHFIMLNATSCSSKVILEMKFWKWYHTFKLSKVYQLGNKMSECNITFLAYKPNLKSLIKDTIAISFQNFMNNDKIKNNDKIM